MISGQLLPKAAIIVPVHGVDRDNGPNLQLLRTVRLITVRSARSGSRQDFRIRRVTKLLASSATTIIDRLVLRINLPFA